MIEVNAVLFWGLCAVAAIGAIQAILTLLGKEPARHWSEPSYAPPGEAPAGFRWVLVKDSVVDAER